jgi:pimeloyl-ACP methyl ester carboxylesterase
VAELLQAPPPRGLLREARGALELPRLLLQLPHLARQPRGRGGPVLVLPGYGAGDTSTALLQGYLRFLGHRPFGWGLGRNGGDVPALLPRVLERIGDLARSAPGGVALVGWSLGGYLAREAARERPEWVRRVVTLGSPVVGGPKYTAVGEIYRRRGVDLDAVEAQVEERYARVLSTPVTAIYSRADAVVAWRACIDRRSPNVEHVEVETTHIGLGFAPEVYGVIASRLAARLPRDTRRGGG